MNNKIERYIYWVLIAALGLSMIGQSQKLKSPTVTPTATVRAPKQTPQPSRTPGVVTTVAPPFTPTASHHTPVPTFTPRPGPQVPTETRLPPSSVQVPFPGAPECEDGNGDGHADVTENPRFGQNPDNELWHGLWNSSDACHYDHEHGDNPFTDEAAQAFPDFDLYALLGNKEIGHTNPSSAIENLHHGGKHGGFEIDVKLNVPGECAAAFEGGEHCVTKAIVGFHAFGDASRELIAKTHSSWALFEVCKRSDPSVCGQMFVNQLQQYGQMISPYQGFLIPFENNFAPAWETARGPYWSIGCVFDAPLPGHFGPIDCRDNLTAAYGFNSSSTVSSKVTGRGARPLTSSLLGILWRTRDNYQLFDTRDLTEPFTFLYLCSDDGGVSYNPVNCPYVNATANIHELAGRIPTAWDGAAFDTDERAGFVGGEVWVTAYGAPAPTCTAPRSASGEDLGCYLAKLSGMPIGFYSDQLIESKSNQFTAVDLPSRNICFLAGAPVNCDLGGVPSGWIGQDN